MYRTYIMGQSAILFDADLLKSLKSNMSIFWKMSWRYYSNWRVLHIDGLEGCDADGHKGRGIPHAGFSPVRYQFFQYPETK
jgi:hypothetical protein